MIRAYSEIVDFIALGATPTMVANFAVSPETKQYVAELIHREKVGSISVEEASELDHFLKIEHLMRLAKAKAKSLTTSTE